MPDILVTNDDSYTSKGIALAASMLSRYGNVTIVAPMFPQSGKSAALSLDDPLRCRHIESRKTANGTTIETYALSGTPADCIKWAANFIYTNKKPNLIVSGINHGANTSAASVYSGTLGAAAEGCLYGVPSIGISIDTHHPDPDFSALEKHIPELVEKFLHSPIPDGIYLNINFPNLPADKIAGIRMASQGKGRWIKEFNKRTDPKGRDYYWMTGNFEDLEESPFGDHRLVSEGYVSIVPHKVDTTAYGMLGELGRIWEIDSEK